MMYRIKKLYLPELPWEKVEKLIGALDKSTRLEMKDSLGRLKGKVR